MTNDWIRVCKANNGAIGYKEVANGDIIVLVKTNFNEENLEVRLDKICKNGFIDWLQGAHIDHALKMISPITRSLILNGYADA